MMNNELNGSARVLYETAVKTECLGKSVLERAHWGSNEQLGAATLDPINSLTFHLLYLKINSLHYDSLKCTFIIKGA